MVLSFRVSELQLLLGSTSQSRGGRKNDLMERALAMIERGVSVPVQLKIKELYQRFAPRSSGGYSSHSSSRSLGLPQHLHSSLSSSSSGNHSSISRVGSSGPGSSVHRGLSELLIQQQRSQIPTHPDVKYKHLPFYDVLGEIMKPTSLVPRSSARQQEARLSFCLNEQQVRDIAMSRPQQDGHVGGDKLDFQVQIQVRFCLLDSSSRQPDLFPSNVNVKVNGMIAQLPNPIPTNKPGAEPKRPGRPVDITKICRLNASVANSMIITYNADDTKNHCVAVYLVKKLDSNILMNRLKRSGLQKTEHTKSLDRRYIRGSRCQGPWIRGEARKSCQLCQHVRVVSCVNLCQPVPGMEEKLSLDKDNDLATTSIRVSLLCPLGKMRMKIPCRASTCNHLQCFDGPTFLQMNEKKPSWICPVCDKPAEFNRLIIDGLFMEIIRGSVDSIEVELGNDGQWRVTKTEDNSDEDSDCNSPPPSWFSGGPSVVMPSNNPPPRTEGSTSNGTSGGGGGECVDLTESDDEAASNQGPHRSSTPPAAYSASPAYPPAPPLTRGAPYSEESGSPGLRDRSRSPLSRNRSPVGIPMPSSNPRDGLSAQPPMAHQTYTPFTLSRHSRPAHAHTNTAQNSVAEFGDYDNGLVPQSTDMSDFLSMIGSISDYSVGTVSAAPYGSERENSLYRSHHSASGHRSRHSPSKS